MRFWAFAILAYLHLSAGTPAPVFAGEEALFPVFLINRRKHQRYAIYVGFTQTGAQEHPVDVAPNDRTQVILSYPNHHTLAS